MTTTPQRRTGVAVAVGLLVGLLVVLSAVPAAARSAAGGNDDDVRELAERYAPRVVIRQQDGPCDPDGEQYAPTSVDIVLDNPQVLLRQVGTADPVVAQGATAADVHDLGGGFYLDFPGDALSPGCIYEQDFLRYSAGRAPVVYAHVATQPDRPGRLALQYWTFWYYNDWNNKHEGDWEGIQILFEVDTVAEALTTEPVSTGYAQHEGGERAGWDDDKLDRDGTHPIVFSSVGSHASYYGSALYLGRSGSEGFGCDQTDGPSETLVPEVVVLPDEVDDPDDPRAWLGFDGRWGERQSGPFNGPTGPADKTRWSAPIDWHDDLRSDSVIVPGGDDQVARLANTFCDVVEWGSARLITLKQQPTVLLVAVLVLVGVVVVVVRRTEWTAVSPLPVARRRRDGELLRAAARVYRSSPGRCALVGLLYLPAALAAGVLVALVSLVPLVGALLSGDVGVGPVGALLTIVVGGTSHAVAFAVATAAAAQVMSHVADGTDPPARVALAELAGHVRPVLAAVLRAAVIVGVLLLSVVGIPWGIRQLIRYQLLAPVVVLEDRTPREALAASSALVRGRWFHTAWTVIVVNGLLSFVGVALGLVLLVVVSGIPLWLFSILVTVVLSLLVPWAAVAIVLLYGDAVAEHTGLDRAEVLDPDSVERRAGPTTAAVPSG